MSDHPHDVSVAYEPPELKVLGTVQELTLQDKRLGLTDGFTFLNAEICNVSVCP